MLLSKRSRGYGDNRAKSSHRLGELLIAAGILKPERLPEALQLAKRTGSPIGRVIVTITTVKQSHIDAALQVQTLIRNATLTEDSGIRILQDVVETSRSLEEVLEQSGHAPEYVVRHALGDLLVSAGMITKPALAEAIRTSSHVGMTLGKYLALTGAISVPVLFEALNLQVALRDKKMSQDQAIANLKEAAFKRTAIASAVVTTQGHSGSGKAPQIKVGELLTMAQIVTESDVLSAIEIGLFKSQPTGKVLIESKLIPDRLLEPALQLQKMVKDAELKPIQAAEILVHVQRRTITVEQAIKEMGIGRRKIEGWKEALDLLKSAGLLGDHYHRSLITIGIKRKNEVGAAILESGLIDDLLFHSALRCVQLLKEKRLQHGQAVIALHYCMRSRSDLDEALKDLSFSP